MRTTVTLDPDTELLLRRRMRERSQSFKQTLNEAIRSGLASGGKDKSAPFRTPTADLGVTAVNLDRALRLAGELEDEELLRKQRAGK
jgi:hypothetical protein